MRIVYLVAHCGVSGGLVVVCQHLRRLRARGHEVWLVTESGERGVDWFPGGDIPALSLNRYPADVDILVATFWSTSFRAFHLPAKCKAYFVQSDETRFHPPGSVLAEVTRLSYRFDYNYLTEARWIQRWLASEFGHDAALVPNGLDEEISHPDEPLFPRGSRPRILLEGAIAMPSKGMAEAFEVVEPLDAAVWCVSSNGRPEKGWRCDRFFERVAIGEMRRIYSACDVLLKLSRVEGFFGPPMEMMACGGTVVVGRVTGHDEYIVDGENALVVEPRDVVAARAAVSRLLAEQPLRERLRRNGLATARAWRWETSIDALEKSFEDLVRGVRGKRADQALAESDASTRGSTRP